MTTRPGASPSQHGPCTPRLIASDLDGTLLDPEGNVPQAVVDALAAARDAGLGVLLITARPPRWLRRLAPLVPGGIIIAGNGAFTYDPHADAVLETRGFSPEQTRAILLRLEGVPGIGFSAELATTYWRDEAYAPAPAAGEEDEGGILAPLAGIDAEAGKILATSSVLAPGEFLEAVTRELGDLAELHLSTDSGLAELSPPGVSKATALAAYAASRGISAEEVWAVGDMPNDLPMLTWAGVGLGVQNAHPDVLAEATAVAPANTEAGVAAIVDAALRSRRSVLAHLDG